MPDVKATFRPRLPGYGPFVPGGAVVVPLSEAVFVDPGTLVPSADQNGTPGAPFAAVQTAVDVLAAKVQGTIVLAPGVYPAEAVTVGATKLTLLGLGTAEAGCDLTLVTFGASALLCLVNLAGVGALTSTAALVLRDTICLAAVAALELVLFSSTVGIATITNSITARDSRLLNGGATQGVNAWDSSFEFVDTAWTISGGQLYNCDFFNNALCNDITFRDCNIAGDFTGSVFRAFNTHVGGGSVNVTVQIVVDWFTYSRLAPALWVATNGVLIQDAPWSPSLRQLAWNAAVVSNLFTVLVANFHAPGMYLVYAPLVVRTVAGAGTATRTITWNAPTLGAQSHVTAGFVLTTLGTKAQDPVLIVSDGLADVTLRYAPVGVAGAPVIDVYAASLQGGLHLFG